MIILLGPDGTGKTTLAKKLELPCYHFVKGSTYEDYILPLSSLGMITGVLDRHMICEYPYRELDGKKFGYTLKQWHNVILLTLIQNPLIILCTHKPTEKEYAEEDHLAYAQWDKCLALYRYFLKSNQMPYVEYDYAGPITLSTLHLMHGKHRAKTKWWEPLWMSGWGCIGSMYPKVLLVAERIGPNNANYLPFETGPTGIMLSTMLKESRTPLGKFAVTNLVKSDRRDPRPPSEGDLDLLREELINLKPEKVVFMGTPAKAGIKVAKELGIEHDTIVHLGYHNYKKTKDMSKYHNEWREIMGITA